MKVAVLRALVWLTLRCRVYYIWSKLYRFLFERKYRKMGPPPKYVDVGELIAFLGKFRWRRDGVMELWDAIGSPRATYHKQVLGVEEGGNDCDEASCYVAWQMRDMALRGVLAGMGVHPRYIYVLSIPWVADGVSGGHNVCLFSYVTSDGLPMWAHFSNWNGGNLFEGFMDELQVVVDVLTRAGASACLGWAMATPDLKLVRYDDGKSATKAIRKKAD